MAIRLTKQARICCVISFPFRFTFLFLRVILPLKPEWLWIQRVQPPGMAAVDQLVVNLAEIFCKSFPDTLA